ncbi:Lrp/AsnC family transcriptional regulator [Tatumella terrea]|uniref:Lrp/AsnC family transcriptional regulator n=1 Tax=Tatumella terrea TaxID=419007 RepID=UPI0031D78CA1
MKKILSLDSLDRRILQSLQKDAAINGATLANAVATSPASCWRRIRAMEASGVITKTVVLVDREMLDQNVDVLCFLRLKSHSENDAKAFETLVHEQECILEGYSVSGEWDYMLMVAVKDIRQYENFLKKVLLNHPSVATVNSQFSLARIKHTTRIPV